MTPTNRYDMKYIIFVTTVLAVAGLILYYVQQP